MQGGAPKAFSLVTGLFQKLLVREKESSFFGKWNRWRVAHTLHSAWLHAYVHLYTHGSVLNWTRGALIIKMKKSHEVLRESCNQFLSFHRVPGESLRLRPFCIVCACVCMPVSAPMLSEARGRCWEFSLTDLLYCPETGSLSKPEVQCFC